MLQGWIQIALTLLIVVAITPFFWAIHSACLPRAKYSSRPDFESG